MWNKSVKMPTAEQALPGRETAIYAPGLHFVNGHSMAAPFPETTQTVLFGLGCFWGAERKFWQQEGVYVTAVGYAAGFTPNPTYQEVCTGKTGHNEVVLVVFEPSVIDFESLLSVFWESHDPTQGMRQGNDIGTQYRSGIYFSNSAQEQNSQNSLQAYQEKLNQVGYGKITTEILPMPAFYYAEEYHQQYLAKNPAGYCGLGGTGIKY
ncbi:MAG: peptide-methionine (S)-S-oxide reductase MsrA [Gammaproteobacteria bacterium]|nr:peptide-methionine (S)-S-oxide reductase MsrA [Gammaproteobacteria bacterium]